MSVVGIDLGTTNTVVSCVRGGRVHVLADEQGRRLLPSVVSFHPSGEVLVGHAAKERRVVDAKNTVFSVKRLIGRSFRTEEVQRAKTRFAFDLREGPGQAPLIFARDREYSLPEISAFVLKRARQIAETALGEPVERAVITVPASFNELQRAATKVAGRIAGLEVLRILNEPTAAALAYGLGKSEKERVAIYDFGGGTFDCTLLDLSGNVFEVLATAGDTFLGGDDIDTAIAERMAEAFLLKHRYDPRTDPQAFERLRAAAEHLKIELSTHPSAQVRLREVAFGVGGAHLDLAFGLSREELRAIADPLLARTLRVTEDALALAGLNAATFGKVILVGGSTRIPFVASRVEGLFAQRPMDHLNPDEVVSIGAAIQAAALTDAARRRSIPPPGEVQSARRVRTIPGVRDRMPSIPPEDGAPPGTARLPNVPSTTARALVAPPVEENGPTTARHPDPAHAALPPDAPAPVEIELAPRPSSSTDARGPLAARTSSVPPRHSAPILIDVTPRALVVETVGGFCDLVIPRNARIPCETTRTFTTSSDDQTIVRVRVAQGENDLFGRNIFLGQVELSGIRPAPRGEVTISVSFEVDANGTLRVQARDNGTGQATQAVLQLLGIADDLAIQEMARRLASTPLAAPS